MQLWLYVPEHARDKSKTQRKGWYLYPLKDKDKKGHYYIGPYLDIQKNKKKNAVTDVAVFKDFPFTRSVQVNEDGEEIPKSVMCTTDRPLTVKELEEAKDGDDVVEQGVTDDDTEDKADDCDDEDDAPGDDDEDEDVDDDEEDEDADDDDEDSDGNWGANDEPPTTNPHSVKRKSRSAPPPMAVVDVPGTEASRGPAPGRICKRTRSSGHSG
jgi:hypothetical protein